MTFDEHKQVSDAQIDEMAPSTAALIEFLRMHPLLAYMYQCASLHRPYHSFNLSISFFLSIYWKFIAIETCAYRIPPSRGSHGQLCCCRDFGSIIVWQQPSKMELHSGIWDSQGSLYFDSTWFLKIGTVNALWSHFAKRKKFIRKYLQVQG